MGKAVILKRISIVDSLKSMIVGKKIEIKNTQAKSISVRSAITRLNKKGYSFSCSEAGRIDSVEVIRLK